MEINNNLVAGNEQRVENKQEEAEQLYDQATNTQSAPDDYDDALAKIRQLGEQKKKAATATPPKPAAPTQPVTTQGATTAPSQDYEEALGRIRSLTDKYKAQKAEAENEQQAKLDKVMSLGKKYDAQQKNGVPQKNGVGNTTGTPAQTATIQFSVYPSGIDPADVEATKKSMEQLQAKAQEEAKQKQVEYQKELDKQIVDAYKDKDFFGIPIRGRDKERGKYIQYRAKGKDRCHTYRVYDDGTQEMYWTGWPEDGDKDFRIISRHLPNGDVQQYDEDGQETTWEALRTPFVSLHGGKGSGVTVVMNAGAEYFNRGVVEYFNRMGGEARTRKSEELESFKKKYEAFSVAQCKAELSRQENAFKSAKDDNAREDAAVKFAMLMKEYQAKTIGFENYNRAIQSPGEYDMKRYSISKDSLTQRVIGNMYEEFKAQGAAYAWDYINPKFEEDLKEAVAAYANDVANGKPQPINNYLNKYCYNNNAELFWEVYREELAARAGVTGHPMKKLRDHDFEVLQKRMEEAAKTATSDYQAAVDEYYKEHSPTLWWIYNAYRGTVIGELGTAINRVTGATPKETQRIWDAGSAHYNENMSFGNSVGTGLFRVGVELPVIFLTEGASTTLVGGEVAMQYAGKRILKSALTFSMLGEANLLASDFARGQCSPPMAHATTILTGAVNGACLGLGGEFARTIAVTPSNRVLVKIDNMLQKDFSSYFAPVFNKASGLGIEVMSFSLPQFAEEIYAGHGLTLDKAVRILGENACIVGGMKVRELHKGWKPQYDRADMAELREAGYDKLAEAIESGNFVRVEEVVDSKGKKHLELVLCGDETSGAQAEMQRLMADQASNERGVTWKLYQKVMNMSGRQITPPIASRVVDTEINGKHYVQMLDGAGRVIAQSKGYTDKKKLDKALVDTEDMVAVQRAAQNFYTFNLSREAIVYNEVLSRYAEKLNSENGTDPWQKNPDGSYALDENGNKIVDPNILGFTPTTALDYLSKITDIPEAERTPEQKQALDDFNKMFAEVDEGMMTPQEVRDMVCGIYGVNPEELKKVGKTRASKRNKNDKAVQAYETFIRVMGRGSVDTSKVIGEVSKADGTTLDIYGVSEMGDESVYFYRDEYGNMKMVSGQEVAGYTPKTDERTRLFDAWNNKYDELSRQYTEDLTNEYRNLITTDLEMMVDKLEEEYKEKKGTSEGDEVGARLQIADMVLKERKAQEKVEIEEADRTARNEGLTDKEKAELVVEWGAEQGVEYDINDLIEHPSELDKIFKEMRGEEMTVEEAPTPEEEAPTYPEHLNGLLGMLGLTGEDEQSREMQQLWAEKVPSDEQEVLLDMMGIMNGEERYKLRELWYNKPKEFKKEWKRVFGKKIKSEDVAKACVDANIAENDEVADNTEGNEGVGVGTPDTPQPEVGIPDTPQSEGVKYPEHRPTIPDTKPEEMTDEAIAEEIAAIRAYDRDERTTEMDNELLARRDLLLAEQERRKADAGAAETPSNTPENIEKLLDAMGVKEENREIMREGYMGEENKDEFAKDWERYVGKDEEDVSKKDVTPKTEPKTPSEPEQKNEPEKKPSMPVKEEDGEMVPDFDKATPSQIQEHLYDSGEYTEEVADEIIKNELEDAGADVEAKAKALDEARANLAEKEQVKPKTRPTTKTLKQFKAEEAQIAADVETAKEAVAQAEKDYNDALRNQVKWEHVRDEREKATREPEPEVKTGPEATEEPEVKDEQKQDTEEKPEVEPTPEPKSAPEPKKPVGKKKPKTEQQKKERKSSERIFVDKMKERKKQLKEDGKLTDEAYVKMIDRAMKENDPSGKGESLDYGSKLYNELADILDKYEDKEIDAKQATKEIDKAFKNAERRSKSAQYSLEEGEGGRSSDMDFREEQREEGGFVDEQEKNIWVSRDRSAAEVMDSVAKRMGLKIRTFNNKSRDRGHIIGDTIWINSNSKRAVGFLLGHEMGHDMENADTEAWRSFRELAIDQARRNYKPESEKDPQTFDEYVKALSDDYWDWFYHKALNEGRSRDEAVRIANENSTEEKILNEIVADTSGNILENTKNAMALLNSEGNMTKRQKLKNHFINFLDKIIRHLPFDTPEFIKYNNLKNALNDAWRATLKERGAESRDPEDTTFTSMMDVADVDASATDAQYSIETEPSVVKKLRGWLDTPEAKELGWTKEKAEKVINETEVLIETLDKALRGDKNYDEWRERKPTVRVDWRDGEEHPVVTWSRGNIEYKYDMSADLLCVNNEGMEGVLSSPVMADLLMNAMMETEIAKSKHTMGNFGKKDYERLYQVLKDLGFTVPCPGCFDFATRLQMLPSVAKDFTDKVNKIVDERNKDPEAFDNKLKEQARKKGNALPNGLPSTAIGTEAKMRVAVAGDNLTTHIDWRDMLTADGQTGMLAKYGGVFRAWQSLGAAKPKDKLLPEPWIGEMVEGGVTTIIAPYGQKTPSFREQEVNVGTGLRRNSHSEFRMTLIVDEMQMLREAFMKNLTVFKYMKELDDVRLFGNLGVKYNMSFFPGFDPKGVAAGLDANGNYIAAEESVGGREFPYMGADGKIHYDGMKGREEAMKYINKDVSLSSVAFSVPHLIKLLTDVPTPSDKSGWVGSIIGFHKTSGDAEQLAAQGLGMARAVEAGRNKGHLFEDEAMTDYHKGVTNFEQVQYDRFGESWEVVEGKKAGSSVAEGHKIEFSGGTHYYNESKGVHLFNDGYVLDSELPNGGGRDAVTNKTKGQYLHEFSVDYNDKVRELNSDYGYKEAADFYVNEFRKLGIIPRFEFTVPEEIFLKMCADANVDPHHPKLGWKGEGNDWHVTDSESYYSLWCDYGMTDPETGKWSPHRPVGVVNENGEREFRMPDNAVEIAQEGMNRYTERRDKETSMENDAIIEYCKRSIEAGRMDAAKANEILKSHGIAVDEASFPQYSLEPMQQKPRKTRAEDIAEEYSQKESREVQEEQQVQYSLETDPKEIERLDKEPVEYGFRNVSLQEDGTFRSPMANKLGKKGEKSRATAPFEMNKWEKSDENPDLATDDGKINLIKPNGLGGVGAVDYNPYIHIRPTTLNKQFKNAWERDDLVYLKVAYPASELDKGYHAEKAKLSVGKHPWNGGELVLSRWDKPLEIVPWEVVADEWVREFKDRGVEFDIVPPKLLPILMERGVKILPPHKGMGKACNDAYKEKVLGRSGEVQYSLDPKIYDERAKMSVEEKDKLRGSEESRKLFDAAKEKFGTTNDVREAGYILPDGTMLDFSGRHWMNEGDDTSHLAGNRAVDHRAIYEVGYDKEENETGFETEMPDFISRGAIRIHTGKDYANINLSMPPTPEQAKALRTLVGRYKDEIGVDFGNGYNSEHYADYNNVLPSRVLGDIDRFYNEGIKPQGTPQYSLEPKEQRKQQESKNFKDWFGDWQNDPENASKVVDEDGRPLIMSHNTSNEFYTFDRERIGSGQGQAYLGAGFNFSRTGNVAYGNNEMKVYLDARNPLESDGHKLTSRDVESVLRQLDEGQSDTLAADFAGEYAPYGSAEYNRALRKAVQTLMDYDDLGIAGSISVVAGTARANDIIAAFKKLGFDSTIEKDNDGRIMNAVVFDNTQIKSATGNNGDFSRENPDIRYSLEGLEGTDRREYIQRMREIYRNGGDVDEQIRQLDEEFEQRKAQAAAEAGEPLPATGFDSNSVMQIALDAQMKAINNTETSDKNRRQAINTVTKNIRKICKGLRDMTFGAKEEEIGQKLSDLEEAREAGAITEEEYNKLKKELQSEIDTNVNVRTAVTAQRDSDRATVSEVVAMAKTLMESGLLDGITKGKIKSIFGKIRNANGKTSVGVRKEIEKLFDLMLDHQTKTTDKSIAELLATPTAKLGANGVKMQGKVGAKTKLTLESMNTHLGKTEDEMNMVLSELINKDTSRMSERELDDHSREIEGAMMAQRYAQSVVACRNNIAEANAELGRLKERYKNGEISFTEYRETKKAIEESVRNYKTDLVKGLWETESNLRELVSEGKGEAKTFFQKIVDRADKVRHWAYRDLEHVDTATQRDKTLGEKYRNSGLHQFFVNSLYTFNTMLRELGKYATYGQGYLFDGFGRTWIDNNGKEWKDNRDAYDQLNAKAHELFGNLHMFGRGPELPMKAQWHNLIDILEKLPTITVDYRDGSSIKPHVLSQAKAAYIYAANKQSDGAVKLRAMGISEADVERIKNELDPRVVKLMDWLQEDFLPSLYKGYSETYERMFGVPMTMNENYFPLEIDKMSIPTVEEKKNTKAVNAATVTGSVKERKFNINPLDIWNSNVISLVAKHIEEMNHWKNFAEWNRDLNTLLNDATFKRKMQNVSSVYGAGDTFWKHFRDTALIASGDYIPEGSGAVDTIILNAAKMVSAAKVSMRPFTATKQALSFMTFVTQSDPKYFVKNLWNEKGTFQWCFENLPSFEKRWKSRRAGDARLQDTDLDWGWTRSKIVKWASKWGLTPNAAVDLWACAIGARSVYETRRDKYLKMGYSEEEAHRRAVQDAEIAMNETQQSSEGMFVAPLQVDRTWESVAQSVFRTASFGFTRRAVRGMKNLKQSFDFKNMQRNAEYMYKKMTDPEIGDGLTDVQAANNIKGLYRRQATQAILDICMYAFGAQAMWNIGGKLPYLLASDDDENRLELIKRELIHSGSAGFIEGLPYGNMLSDQVSHIIDAVRDNSDFDSALKQYKSESRNFNSELMPIISDLANIKRELFSKEYLTGVTDLFNLGVQVGIGINPQTFTDGLMAVLDRCNNDTELAKEALIMWYRIANVPQSQVENLMIEEIGMTAKDAKKLTVDEVAQRYVYFRKYRRAPYLWELYNDAQKKEIEKTYEDRFYEKVYASADDPGSFRELADLSVNRRDKFIKKYVEALVAEGPDSLASAYASEKAPDVKAALGKAYFKMLNPEKEKDKVTQEKLDSYKSADEDDKKLKTAAKYMGPDDLMSYQKLSANTRSFYANSDTLVAHVKSIYKDFGLTYNKEDKNGNKIPLGLDEVEFKIPVKDANKRKQVLDILNGNEKHFLRVKRSYWRHHEVDRLIEEMEEDPSKKDENMKKIKQIMKDEDSDHE